MIGGPPIAAGSYITATAAANAGSTGRRNTRVTLTKRSPNRLQDNRLPAMPKLRFLGRS